MRSTFSYQLIIIFFLSFVTFLNASKARQRKSKKEECLPSYEKINSEFAIGYTKSGLFCGIFDMEFITLTDLSRAALNRKSLYEVKRSQSSENSNDFKLLYNHLFPHQYHQAQLNIRISRLLISQILRLNPEPFSRFAMKELNRYLFWVKKSYYLFRFHRLHRTIQNTLFKGDHSQKFKIKLLSITSRMVEVMNISETSYLFGRRINPNIEIVSFDDFLREYREMEIFNDYEIRLPTRVIAKLGAVGLRWQKPIHVWFSSYLAAKIESWSFNELEMESQFIADIDELLESGECTEPEYLEELHILRRKILISSLNPLIYYGHMHLSKLVKGIP